MRPLRAGGPRWRTHPQQQQLRLLVSAAPDWVDWGGAAGGEEEG